MTLTLEQVAKAVASVDGNRKYIPVDVNEATLIFKRNNYFHLFVTLHSRAGMPSVESMAKRIMQHMTLEDGTQKEFHPEFIGAANGI